MAYAVGTIYDKLLAAGEKKCSSAFLVFFVPPSFPRQKSLKRNKKKHFLLLPDKDLNSTVSTKADTHFFDFYATRINDLNRCGRS